MDTISALHSGVSGIQSGLKSFNQNADKIVKAGTTEPQNSVTDPLVNMISDKQQVQASAKVIQTSNNMIGSLLDIKV